MASKDDNGVFTITHPFDMSDPKSWAATLEKMSWDNDRIVFSKRSLLEFLHTLDKKVDPKFTEIEKLPKYASFGEFDQATTNAAVSDLVDAEIADPTHDSKIHPSRSTVPRKGGKHHQPLVPAGGAGKGYTIEPQEYEEADALSLAPPRDGGDGVDVEFERLERLRVHVEPDAQGGAKIEDEKEAPKVGEA